MNISDCLSIYNRPGCALTLHLRQDCPSRDLKLLPGCIILICVNICTKSIKI